VLVKADCNLTDLQHNKDQWMQKFEERQSGGGGSERTRTESVESQTLSRLHQV
jgi:hypothetical protein